jgi:hypothetical protein
MVVLVGLLAGSQTADRAVITGLRNFIRDIGGGLGITGTSHIRLSVHLSNPSATPPNLTFLSLYSVSGTILNNILYNGLKDKIAPQLISQLASLSTLALAELDLSEDERRLISAVYMRGLSAVFSSYAALLAVFFFCCFFVQDYGLVGGRRQKDGSNDNGSSNPGITRNEGGDVTSLHPA